MNLLMLILILLGIAVAVAIFRVAWRLTGEDDIRKESEEPGEAKESKESPGSSERL
jgi:hypothetical protein